MVDTAKHVAYWRQGAQEDAAVARHLVDTGRVRHGLFFAHLALEKALKAVICLHSGDLAPRIHNLVRLAEAAGVDPDATQLDLLADMNQFNLEGRYPGIVLSPPTVEEAGQFMRRTEGVIQWLIRQS